MFTPHRNSPERAAMLKTRRRIQEDRKPTIVFEDEKSGSSFTFWQSKDYTTRKKILAVIEERIAEQEMQMKQSSTREKLGEVAPGLKIVDDTKVNTDETKGS
jgi:hypothetical protein